MHPRGTLCEEEQIKQYGVDVLFVATLSISVTCIDQIQINIILKV